MQEDVLPGGATQFSIKSYRDLAHYEMPGALPYYQIDYTVEQGTLMDNDTALLTSAYDWLKANRPEWSGASDV